MLLLLSFSKAEIYLKLFKFDKKKNFELCTYPYSQVTKLPLVLNKIEK